LTEQQLLPRSIRREAHVALSGAQQEQNTALQSQEIFGGLERSDIIFRQAANAGNKLQYREQLTECSGPSF